jgi:hypothetical protein
MHRGLKFAALMEAAGFDPQSAAENLNETAHNG